MIEHTGIIDSIQDHRFRILITQQSECSACDVKGACSISGQQEKIVEVESFDSSFKVGEKVLLAGKNTFGLLAVFLAFVIPFILILITLVSLQSLVSNEIISGGIALFILVPYYLILSLFNKRLKTKFNFEIKKEYNE
jgi:sigma-E factor negative regulatory protein RseC